MEKSRSLLSLLGRSNFEKIPEDVAKKMEKLLDEANSKVSDLKNLHNGSQKTIEKFRKDLQAVRTESEHFKEMLSTSETSVTELRQQLNTANVEKGLFTERIKNEEIQNKDWRKKRDDLVDQKNELMDISGRKDTKISQLESHLKSLQQQFHSELSEKEDVKARLAEITRREQLLIDNEKRQQIEIERLKKEVVNLTDNYNEKSAELTNVHENLTSVTARLEIDLKEKSEELHAANFIIRQFTKSTQLSTSQCDKESIPLKNQLNESATLIEHYKRELDAKIKLVDLYKANFDESQAQTVELRTEVVNLNHILKETTEKCELLDSKLNNSVGQHQLELTQLNATIEKLKGELKVAGELLKSAETERAEKVLEKMFPRAATSNRMLKNNATLTEIFSRYHDSLDDVHRLEIECLQMNTKLGCLTIKLQDTTSELERQQVEYRKILKLNEEMTEQMDSVVAEQDSVREKLKENSQRLAQAESENVQLKCTQKDLARQICNLLNKVETNDNEPTSDQLQLKRLGLSNEAIRKELITFDNIVELQENNQKLMLKIRELSIKVDKLEEQNTAMKSVEQKNSFLERRLSDGEVARQANEDLLAMTTKQKERFKQLYFEAMSYMGKRTEEEVTGNAALSSSQSTHHMTADWKDKKYLEVELNLQEKVKELKVLKEDYNEYREQAKINFDMLKVQCESVERKVDELISENSKLRSRANFINEQMESRLNDIAIYKKQIQILEERNEIYNKTIAKHELAIKEWRNEYWSAIVELSSTENRFGYLEMECRRALEAKKNVEIENNALHRLKLTQKLLESSCELAKISSERSDFEGRIQLEKHLEDQTRQYEALKLKLNDEQKRFTEESESLKRQRENATNKLLDEQADAESLRTKLSEAREEIETKALQITNLSKKLQVAFATSNSNACLSNKNKSFKDLEVELKNKTAEIEQLNSELKEFAAKAALFDTLKSNWEAEKNGLKSDLEARMLSESNSKSHITELQQEIRVLSLLKATVAVENNIQAEFREALEMITGKNKELQELRRQCHQLKENLQVIEKNYAIVLSAHSADLQSLTLLKVELNNSQQQTQELKLAKVESDELSKKRQLEWEATNRKLIDGRQELEHKVAILEKQTLELLDLMQAQNLKPASAEIVSEYVARNSFTVNQTLADNELEKFTSEKLFGVVKYLRREKEIAATQMEILNIENARLVTELDLQKNKVNELSCRSNSEDPSSINNVSYVLSPAEYDELRRNAETLNAVTDSNIHLRAEKEDLNNRVRDLAEKVDKLEAERMPLQEKNQELFELSDNNATENTMMRSNIDQLQVKLDLLENECKNLTDKLASEKENVRQATEEFNLIKADKSRLEQEIESKSKHLQMFPDIRAKLMQKISKQEEEIKEAKNRLKVSAENELKARKEAKSLEKQCLELRAKCEKTSDTSPNPELLKKDHVTSAESVSPVTAAMQKPSSLKRSRDIDANKPMDMNIVSTAEKVSPQPKRTRLQRGGENIASKTNVDEGIDADNGETELENDGALLPGAQQVIVDGKRTETGGDASTATVCDDTISEVESVDSGRVSTEFTMAPEDLQLGRVRRISSRTEAIPARRGRSRSNK